MLKTKLVILEFFVQFVSFNKSFKESYKFVNISKLFLSMQINLSMMEQPGR